ncbi:MAG TPA: cob(I)yrinic acid a,c-diamide adenosyltransferase [Methanocella sp.]|uniref:cob(I)yrinic acid a,c-diamide adenosyltransferase n=1 Tax=Methanocella sp. TaxID=2052833 RepID=UPI002C459727|nr:cob(I)yrinic acid a,c-diamide adenosyltransferase [Methanocella sp.]HTY91730.1 cob(I)yrinic acid a,c-diamide adenosyltransferase [Methanocella sp.]
MGYVYIYYGTGAGKTTSALGLALRSIGQGRKVVIVQFLKWWKDTGEYKITGRLKPDYEVRQFGRPGWICRNAGRGEVNEGGVVLKVRGIEEADREMARKGLEFAGQKLAEKPGLLVLDEICLAAHMGILAVEDVLGLIRDLPAETDVVMTGRFAPIELMERADFVNEIVPRKFPGKLVTKRGNQY